ncbi:hypothetical protein J8281_16615 [Aquimarina sp. U1-2]|uniref:hypothetical protein n=1 Tax=Aquimarina sp. U1-2 TaxID=2823141 RepID=UPI001AECDEB7|nr:hypothetical protein [Aquimarina sp. U1-2]MBP2833820.1 hypothetical protein [Aquimarina sp. U1-2]
MEVKETLEKLMTDLVTANVTITYLKTNQTLLGKKIQSKYPELLENKNKDVNIEFNGHSNPKHYENSLKLLVNRLEYQITDLKNKEFYVSEFERAFENISFQKEKRDVFFSRKDIIEHIDPKSDFWIDEMDDFIKLNQKRKLSDFVEIQNSILTRVLEILNKSETIETIEDLVPDEEKRRHLKKWLIENGYCDDNFVWIDLSKGNKSKLGYLLGFVIPLKNFSNIEATKKDLVKVAENSFKLKISVETIQKALNNLKLKDKYKTLSI